MPLETSEDRNSDTNWGAGEATSGSGIWSCWVGETVARLSSGVSAKPSSAWTWSAWEDCSDVGSIRLRRGFRGCRGVRFSGRLRAWIALDNLQRAKWPADSVKAAYTSSDETWSIAIARAEYTPQNLWPTWPSSTAWICEGKQLTRLFMSSTDRSVDDDNFSWVSLDGTWLTGSLMAFVSAHNCTQLNYCMTTHSSYCVLLCVWKLRAITTTHTIQLCASECMCNGGYGHLCSRFGGKKSLHEVQETPWARSNCYQ